MDSFPKIYFEFDQKSESCVFLKCQIFTTLRFLVIAYQSNHILEMESIVGSLETFFSGISPLRELCPVVQEEVSIINYTNRVKQLLVLLIEAFIFLSLRLKSTMNKNENLNMVLKKEYDSKNSLLSQMVSTRILRFILRQLLELMQHFMFQLSNRE